MNKFLAIIFFIFMNYSVIANEGQELHQQSCKNCHIVKHNKDFYNRADKKINNFKALKIQVNRCASMFNTGWFPEEQSSVVTYLNNHFYRFNVK